MRKNVATDSSRGQPTAQSQQNMDEESTFENLTELTTVLGEYAAASPAVAEKGKSSWISVIPILLIIALLAALGAGGYAYMQKSSIAQTQKDLVKMQSLAEKIASSGALILANDAKANAWANLDNYSKQLNSSWDPLVEAVPALAGLASAGGARDLLNAAINDLNKQKSAVTNALNQLRTTGNEAAAGAEIQIVQEKIAGVASKAQVLASGIGEASEQFALEADQRLDMLNLVLLGACVLALLLALLVSRQFVMVKRGRGREMGQLSALVEDLQDEAERQRHTAQEQVAAARRVNEANQAAILRLMNELQNLAEGDLTQQATVTEDITGAIADSVNYTVEELRTLVAQVQTATVQVSKTTAVVESTSTELLASSDEQLHEIRETGQSILDVAKRINAVSSQAQQSAQVATQSLAAADKGLNAVQNAIGGMNTIREQIQDTSKRIKRLVESSQEIGEITDLITGITEQTNVLALNAAIQAASAGEAGRGFSVVAEEVQRLAERSANATRQIAVLVKTIQEDMQDAMAAMERSTQGVVEGARLSDQTGTAFSEINTVAKRLANLIQQISLQAENEANVANSVADNIQHIFAVTEQTADGTRSTAQQVRELARVANQLERSVARFKIS